MHLVRRMAWKYSLLVLLAMVFGAVLAASSDQSSLRSKEGNIETEIDFINSMDEPIAVYWIDYDGNKKLYATLKPGERYSQHTYVTHPWIVMTVSAGKIVGFATGRVGKQTFEARHPCGDSGADTSLAGKGLRNKEGERKQEAAGEDRAFWGAYVTSYTGSGYALGREVYGLSWNARSMEEAERGAVRGCIKRGGSTCETHERTIVRFSTTSARDDHANNTINVVRRARCIAIGRDAVAFSFGVGDTEYEAKSDIQERRAVRLGDIRTVKCNNQ